MMPRLLCRSKMRKEATSCCKCVVLLSYRGCWISGICSKVDQRPLKMKKEALKQKMLTGVKRFFLRLTTCGSISCSRFEEEVVW